MVHALQSILLQMDMFVNVHQNSTGLIVNMILTIVIQIHVGIMVSVKNKYIRVAGILSFAFQLGTCHRNSTHDFFCECSPGWQGTHCEFKLDLCRNITCLNHGQCWNSWMNFSCVCLDDNYSGRYCEMLGNKIQLKILISKCFGWISITALSMVAGFVLVMDFLKFVLKIDPLKSDRKYLRKKFSRKPKRMPVIQRFIYVQ